MSTIVLGLMKDRQQAQSAMQALDLEGFERDDLDASGALNAVLAQLGVPDQDAEIFAEGVRRGGTVVCVRAEDELEAEHAAHLLMAHGAVDLESCVSIWRADGSGFGEPAAAPGRMYFKRGRRHAASAFLRGAVTDGPYTGPERRDRAHLPLDDGNRRGD